MRVERPRLRRRGQGTGGEVEVPAYEAMNRPGPVAQRMLEILLAGVSTRKYARVIPAMAETVGVSRSAVSRETIEASERVLKKLMERRLDGWDLLVIYLDGIQFGDYHVLGAVGVDVEGKKHVLGVREGASENAEVARALLEDLVVRGVDTGRRRLFVLDGSKALRSALDQVFGRQHPVQRCRNHKARNVVGHLPKELQAQARATMRAAWKLEAKEGEQKLDQFARWLERDHPSAAASLREGLRRDVHDQPARPAAAAASLLDEHELDRQHPLGCATEDAPGDELEERDDGAPVGGFLIRRDREELPQDYRTPGALDAQGPPR